MNDKINEYADAYTYRCGMPKNDNDVTFDLGEILHAQQQAFNRLFVPTNPQTYKDKGEDL